MRLHEVGWINGFVKLPVSGYHGNPRLDSCELSPIREFLRTRRPLDRRGSKWRNGLARATFGFLRQETGTAWFWASYCEISVVDQT